MNIQLAICAIGPVMCIGIYTLLKKCAASLRRRDELRKRISQEAWINRHRGI